MLPAVPMRQWVLSLPIKVRWVLARRPAPVGRVLAVFLRALSPRQRRRGRSLGVAGSTGTVTFVQRFGSALQLNIHFHAVVPDGVFVPGDDGAVSFARLPPPTDDDVELLLHRTASMKRPLPDGRTHLVLDGVGLLRKLAPLIPPPRFHLLRFHGVFAPNAKLRSRVVPKPPPKAETATTTPMPDRPRTRHTTSPYRLDWAAALKRVFAAARPVASRPRRARRAGAASTCCSARAAAAGS